MQPNNLHDIYQHSTWGVSFGQAKKKKNALKAKFNYSKYSVWLQAKQVECDPVLHTTNCWSPYIQKEAH